MGKPCKSLKKRPVASWSTETGNVYMDACFTFKYTDLYDSSTCTDRINWSTSNSSHQARFCSDSVSEYQACQYRGEHTAQKCIVKLYYWRHNTLVLKDIGTMLETTYKFLPCWLAFSVSHWRWIDFSNSGPCVLLDWLASQSAPILYNDGFPTGSEAYARGRDSCLVLLTWSKAHCWGSPGP